MKLNGIEVQDTAAMAPQQEKEPWWGPPAFITYSDEQGALVVHVIKRRRKGDLAVAAALAIAGALCFSFPEARPFGFGLIFVGVVYGFGAVHMTGTTMTVSPLGLSSTFTGRLLKKRAEASWEKAGRLTYMTQTRNRPKGLYARRSFVSYTCLIPYISSKQTDEVIKKSTHAFRSSVPSRDLVAVAFHRS